MFLYNKDAENYLAERKEIMTLNQILYFRKVARLENYHQAAEELYISQPSLSRSMASLESELGVALFEKKRQRSNAYKGRQAFSGTCRPDRGGLRCGSW